ncbi:hypothetical protein [Lacticaseibacillus parakribbianus]|uniref:hypothetical protein n=1 Tax=Lacticaseibacillus parakribbianus TaxID=2970927 RepID=UPI0021CB8794|nr:hypothetical protein [Lacticaseibacillus parakribbianus]
MSRKEKIEYIFNRLAESGRQYSRRQLEAKSDKVLDAMYLLVSDAEDREIQDEAASITI